MLRGFATLLAFQFAGELLARTLSLSVPGPVLGMAGLFVVMLLRGGPSRPLGEAADGLLKYLSLMFIPAGVGIMLYGDTLAEQWRPLVLVIVVGTLVTLVVTAATLLAVHRLQARRRPHHG